MSRFIKSKVREVVATYGTTDPLQLADLMGIDVVFDSLSIKGLYIELEIQNTKIQSIILNNDIRYSDDLGFVVAHEIGHALLHHDSLYLYHCGVNEKQRDEREANEFATRLLLYDEIIEEDDTVDYVLSRNHIPNDMGIFLER